MALRLDVDEDGAKWVAYAKNLLTKLKVQLNNTGMNFVQKTFPTPDSLGLIYLRIQRGTAQLTDAPYAPASPVDWYDYIRIETDSRGYLVQPFMRHIASDTVLVGESPPIYRLGLKGGPFQEFKDFSIQQMSPYPQVDRKHVNTGAFEYLFGDGVKIATPTLGTSIGKWKHQYVTPPPESAERERIFSMHVSGSNFRVRDSEDGDLAESGVNRFTLANAGLTMTYMASKNGKYAVVDYDDTGNKRYLLDIDYARDAPKIVTSLLPNTSSSGTPTSNTVGDVTTYTGFSTIPLTYGPSNSGSIKNELLVGFMTDTVSTSSVTAHFVSPPYTYDEVWNYNHVLGFKMPSGVILKVPATTVKFTVRATEFDIQLAGVELREFQSFAIIYSDPTVPCVVYDYTYRIRTPDPATYVNIPVASGSMQMNGLMHTRLVREVGIAIGSTLRTLFSETTPSFDLTFTAGLTGSALIGPSGVPSSVNVSGGRQLRIAPAGAGSGDKYVIDVMDTENWVMSFTHMTGAFPEVRLYAGLINESKLRTSFKNRLIAILQDKQAITPNPLYVAAIAALEADSLTAYDIRLSGLRLVAPATPDPWEPRAGTPSLI